MTSDAFVFPATVRRVTEGHSYIRAVSSSSVKSNNAPNKESLLMNFVNYISIFNADFIFMYQISYSSFRCVVGAEGPYLQIAT